MKNKNIIIWTTLVIMIVLTWFLILNYKNKVHYNNLKQEEKEKIVIDEYNFKQLEKVKDILDWLKKDSYNFKWLNEFNKIFNQNIIPINNCYYTSSANWNEPYIFWFKLESNTYIEKYWDEYYSYPKYDLPIIPICFGFWKWEWNTCSWDRNFEYFIKTTSNPCE